MRALVGGNGVRKVLSNDVDRVTNLDKQGHNSTAKDFLELVSGTIEAFARIKWVIEGVILAYVI